jgi:hypothetical protein
VSPTPPPPQPPTPPRAPSVASAPSITMAAAPPRAPSVASAPFITMAAACGRPWVPVERRRAPWSTTARAGRKSLRKRSRPVGTGNG